jgi:hypothetical protein
VAKLYTNENIPLPVVESLRQLGHDVMTSLDSGQANRRIPDELVLDFAIEASRILITFNRKHFIRLHEQKPDHTGIVVCTVDANFNALAERIHTALEAHAEMNGQLLRVNRPNQETSSD